MKKLYYCCFILFALTFFPTCATFEPDEFIPFATFENTLGGGGADEGNDVIELRQGYLIVGAAGPECDIMDGVAILLDKTTGQTIQFNHFGLPGEGNEDSLFDVAKISDDEFLAVGFSAPKAEVVPYDSTQLCKVYEPGFISSEQNPYPNPNGNIFFASFDSTLSILQTRFIASSHPASSWDAAYSLSVREDKIYIAGAWHAFNGLLELDENLGIKDSIILASTVGEYNDVDINRDNGTITITGFTRNFSTGINCKELGIRMLNFTKKNENIFINKNYDPPAGFIAIMGESINKADDGGYLIVGSAIDVLCKEYILTMRITEDGTELWRKYSKKGRALDVNKVEDGYVMTGSTEDDLFIMKIDLEGNEIWTEQYDYRGLGNVQEGKSIIATDDGGFLVVGKSANSDNTSSTIYVVKTDSRGKVR